MTGARSLTKSNLRSLLGLSSDEDSSALESAFLATFLALFLDSLVKK